MRPIALWVMIAGLVCGSAWAINGDMGASSDPNGSPERPYLIEDVNDFDVFASDPAYWAAGVHTQLMTNIDLSGRTYTTAVIAPDTDNSNGPNFDGKPFSAVLDGNEFIISNLLITDGYSFVGFFGRVSSSGTVTDLRLESINVSGTGRTGGLIADNLGVVKNCFITGIVNGDGGLVGGNSGLIQNCRATVTVEGGQPGGLVGTNNSVITNCSASGIVIGDYCVGGLVAWSGVEEARIENSFAKCDVQGNTAVGGLVGMNKADVLNCYSSGIVSGGSSVGGIAGSNDFNANISMCYSSGVVSGSSSVGGIVGSNGSSANISMCYSLTHVSSQSDIGSGSAGGIVGSTAGAGLISHCYAAGVTSGTGNIGGIMGIEYNHANYGSCFWDITKNPSLQDSGNRGEVAEVHAESTDNLKIQSTFTGWDFSDDDGDPAVWTMLREGEDYPRLAWQEIYRGDIAGLYGADWEDVAYLGRYWGLDGCDSGTDCGRADIDDSGAVDLPDLAAVAEDWLRGL